MEIANEDINKIYDFLKVINEFKSVERLSVIKENGRRESDAEHTWHLIMFVWLYSSLYEHKVDLLKSIKLALVHDLVEIYAGDIYGGALPEVRAGKEEREALAAKKLFSQLPNNLKGELSDLWNEYEQRKSDESIYVACIDKILPGFMKTITKKDLAENMPTDYERSKSVRENIVKTSTLLSKVLKRTRKERGLETD